LWKGDVIKTVRCLESFRDQRQQYAFTYQKGGLQYDTGWYSWTHP